MAAATEPSVTVRAAVEDDVAALAMLAEQLAGHPTRVEEMRERYARFKDSAVFHKALT